MHITLLTIGSRGDVEPIIALGVGLHGAGFGVRLATHGRFENQIRAYGLEFAPIHSDPLAVLQSADGRAWLDSGQNPVQLVQGMVRLGRPQFEQMIKDATAALAGTDAVIYTLFGNVAYHLAEKMGIPAVLALLQPVLGRTAAYPVPGSPLLPARLPFIGKVYNQLTYRMVEQVFWQPFRPLVNQWRQEVLNLKPTRFLGPLATLWGGDISVLYGYSAHVVPRPYDWASNQHITGYWFTPPTEQWRPPSALEEFLADGPPPVYIGFGSMTDRDAATLGRIVHTALERTGQRAVLLAGWAGLSAAESNKRVIVLDEVPHNWLMPKMAAAVHHGGAGTTAAGLRAGVPNLLIPYFADQHFWGERVYRLGVGPQPIPRVRLTPEALAEALWQAVYNQPMRRAAAKLGHAITQEDGVGRAVELVSNYLQSVARKM